MQTTIERAESSDHWAAARRLVEEYATSLSVDLAFQDFQREITSLAIEYGPPRGCFLLAVQAGAFIGCGGLRRFSDSACEMKRLYVAPGHRGEGVGRLLAEALIGHGRRLGYETMLLDTLPTMDTAQDLYASLGFEPAPAYRYNPVPGATFRRLTLRSIPSQE